MTMPRIAYAVITLLIIGASAGAQSLTPVGVWRRENKRIEVDIAPCGGELCGTLVWFKRPNDAQGLPLVDFNNPDPALRARPLLGLEILRGFRPDGDGKWVGGTSYNPDDGETYRATMSMQEDGNVRVRAYVFLPMFGETQIWTRVR